MTTKSRLISKLIDGKGIVKSSLLDSDGIRVSTEKSVTTAAGTDTYSSADTLPTSATNGDQALVTSTNKLYIYSGSGWYNIALVNNTPYWSTEASSSYDLNVNGTSTTITILAVDSEGVPIIYTAVTDSDFNQIATVTKDSDNGRVFIVTPTDSENGAGVGGTGTITFKASDGVNLVSTLSTFNLTFITSIDSSNYTRLLTKADSSSTDNQVDASTNSHTITESGNVISTAFSPHHPGGYSTYIDGTNDWLVADLGTNIGTSDFTIEGWVKSDVNAHHGILQISDASTGYKGTGYGNTLAVLFQSGYGWQVYGRGGAANSSGPTAITVNQWYHFAYVKTGGTAKLYVDGVEVITASDTTNYAARYISIGRVYNTAYDWTGHIRDVRVVVGTAVYTSSFTPPTEPLIAITNTKLLTCHLPYIGDGSVDSRSITVNGNPQNERISPYDHEAYTKTDHGGSVYFDGTGDYLTVPDGAYKTYGSGDFTIEMWFYTTAAFPNNWLAADANSASTTSTMSVGIFLESPNVKAQVITNTGTKALNGTNSVKQDMWNHVAVTRYGTALTLWINGVASATVTIGGSETVNDSIENWVIGRCGGYDGVYFNGYISDFRLVKGTAVYTSAFTPPTAPLTAIANTELLTCTNKNPIWDASTGKEWIQKGSGTVTVSNTQRKFTTSSAIQFTNGSGNYLYADLGETIGTRDFTIEAWVYTTSTTGQYAVQISNVAGVGYQSITSTNTQVGFGIQGGIWRHLSTGGWPLTGYVHTGVSATINTWHHVAQVRTGGSSKLYLNGTLISTNADTNNYSARYVAYGCGNIGYVWAGYIQDLRITLDHARYTSNFTPPTAEFDG